MTFLLPRMVRRFLINKSLREFPLWSKVSSSITSNFLSTSDSKNLLRQVQHVWKTELILKGFLLFTFCCWQLKMLTFVKFQISFLRRKGSAKLWRQKINLSFRFVSFQMFFFLKSFLFLITLFSKWGTNEFILFIFFYIIVKIILSDFAFDCKLVRALRFSQHQFKLLYVSTKYRLHEETLDPLTVNSNKM